MPQQIGGEGMIDKFIVVLWSVVALLATCAILTAGIFIYDGVRTQMKYNYLMCVNQAKNTGMQFESAISFCKD